MKTSLIQLFLVFAHVSKIFYNSNVYITKIGTFNEINTALTRANTINKINKHNKLSKNGQVNQQASADRPVSSLFFIFIYLFFF